MYIGFTNYIPLPLSQLLQFSSPEESAGSSWLSDLPASPIYVAGWYNLKAMRYAILLGLCALTLLESQTVDPNKTGFPHDMIWFNEPKNPQPGVTHHGYHSALMNKEVGYNIWLPPGYDTSSQQYPVVYWLHGRNNTESSDQYPVHLLAESVANGTVPPMILVYASG